MRCRCNAAELCTTSVQATDDIHSCHAACTCADDIVFCPPRMSCTKSQDRGPMQVPTSQMLLVWSPCLSTAILLTIQSQPQADNPASGPEGSTTQYTKAIQWSIQWSKMKCRPQPSSRLSSACSHASNTILSKNLKCFRPQVLVHARTMVT
jgi:hypothetical protein